jgi:hypothetical protein
VARSPTSQHPSVAHPPGEDDRPRSRRLGSPSSVMQ